MYTYWVSGFNSNSECFEKYDKWTCEHVRIIVIWCVVVTVWLYSIGSGFQDESGDKSKSGEEEQDEDSAEDSKSGVVCPMLLSYNDAPNYLKFNPYIRSGYRGFLTTKMCVER